MAIRISSKLVVFMSVCSLLIVLSFSLHCCSSLRILCFSPLITQPASGLFSARVRTNSGPRDGSKSCSICRSFLLFSSSKRRSFVLIRSTSLFCVCNDFFSSMISSYMSSFSL